MISVVLTEWMWVHAQKVFRLNITTRERGFLRTVSLDVYGSNAVLEQFVKRKSIAMSFFQLKTVLDLSPNRCLAV